MSTSNKLEVVGLFDSSFRQLIPDAVVMSATVTEDSKIFTHPLETGVEVADHKIITPVEIAVSVVLPRGIYRDLYAQIRQIFHGDNVFTVQTRAQTYTSMALASMPHEENPEMFDVIPMTLTFTEAQFVETQFQALPPKKVRNKRDASTVKRGEQQGKKGSLLYRAGTKVGLIKKETTQ